MRRVSRPWPCPLDIGECFLNSSYALVYSYDRPVLSAMSYVPETAHLDNNPEMVDLPFINKAGESRLSRDLQHGKEMGTPALRCLCGHIIVEAWVLKRVRGIQAQRTQGI